MSERAKQWTRYIKSKTLELECWDIGHAFDRSKFKPIRNSLKIKPSGGLWTSPVSSEWGWKHWARSESFRPLEQYFRLRFFGRVYTINSVADLRSLPWYNASTSYIRMSLNFELMAPFVDAIHLTMEGEQATRFSEPNLYGWDCESVLVFNPDCVTQIESCLRFSSEALENE